MDRSYPPRRNNEHFYIRRNEKKREEMASIGVSHPAWTATAYDMVGRRVVSTGEQLLAEFKTIPGEWFDLEANSQRPIAMVRIESDYRTNGRPFAGFHAALINEIVLYY